MPNLCVIEAIRCALDAAGAVDDGIYIRGCAINVANEAHGAPTMCWRLIFIVPVEHSRKRCGTFKIQIVRFIFAARGVLPDGNNLEEEGRRRAARGVSLRDIVACSDAREAGVVSLRVCIARPKVVFALAPLFSDDFNITRALELAAAANATALFGGARHALPYFTKLVPKLLLAFSVPSRDVIREPEYERRAPLKDGLTPELDVRADRPRPPVSAWNGSFFGRDELERARPLEAGWQRVFVLIARCVACLSTFGLLPAASGLLWRIRSSVAAWCTHHSRSGARPPRGRAFLSV